MAELKRALRLRTVVATSAGMAMATSCYVAGVEIANMVAGQTAWIAILVAGVMCMLSALCFSELSGMYPSAAGLKLYIERAFGERTAIIVGAFYIACAIAIVGPETHVLSKVIGRVFPNVPSLVWVFLFLGIIALVNLRGIIVTGWVQDVLSYSMITFMLIVGGYAIAVSGVEVGEFFHPGDAVGVVEAAALGVFLYVAFEWVTPLAEEVTDGMMIPKGMLMAVGLLAITYVVFITGMTSVVDKEILAGSRIPHMLMGETLFGRYGLWFFAFMSIMASMTSYNAGFLNFSRFMYAMGRDNILPRVFSKLHPSYATPWFAVLFTFTISIIASLYVFFTERVMILIKVTAAIEVIIYIAMALAVIKLRRSKRDEVRPFKIPGGIVVPVLAILFFLVLLVGIYADDIVVLYIMLSILLVCVLYTLTVVPRLKAAYEARMAKRVPRRRRPGSS